MSKDDDDNPKNDNNKQNLITDDLAQLTKREREVLRQRFGIDMNADHTVDEVAEQLKVTREKIREIEKRAIRKLRHPSGEFRCSFCNKTSSEVGGLCQADNDAAICLQCAKTAIEMFETERGDE